MGAEHMTTSLADPPPPPQTEREQLGVLTIDAFGLCLYGSRLNEQPQTQPRAQEVLRLCQK
jgi:hypothetical protein